MTLVKCVRFFERPVAVACDAKCNKAWGIGHRPANKLSDDDDDFEWLSDDETGEAPIDPGTYEGGHAKPQTPEERMNKWCVRACERSTIVGMGEIAELRDFTRRIRNIPPCK